MQENKNKKLIIAGIFLTALAAGAGIWIWRSGFGGKPTGKEGVEKREVEALIDVTKARLEELEKLSPEEKARREREREVLSASKVSEDVPVGGVEVILGVEKKIIKNRAQGYRVEIPLNLLLARSVSSDLLELHDREFMCEGDPLCEPVIRIEVRETNPRELSLEGWFAEEEKGAGAPIYSPRERLKIGELDGYRASEVIPARFEGYYYYFAQGKKIYSLRISAADDPSYRKFIDTFRFE